MPIFDEKIAIRWCGMETLKEIDWVKWYNYGVVELNWTELMVYFRLAVKRPNGIKIHDKNNTVTTEDMYIQAVIRICE